MPASPCEGNNHSLYMPVLFLREVNDTIAIIQQSSGERGVESPRRIVLARSKRLENHRQNYSAINMTVTRKRKSVLQLPLATPSCPASPPLICIPLYIAFNQADGMVKVVQVQRTRRPYVYSPGGTAAVLSVHDKPPSPVALSTSAPSASAPGSLRLPAVLLANEYSTTTGIINNGNGSGDGAGAAAGGTRQVMSSSPSQSQEIVNTLPAAAADADADTTIKAISTSQARSLGTPAENATVCILCVRECINYALFTLSHSVEISMLAHAMVLVVVVLVQVVVRKFFCKLGLAKNVRLSPGWPLWLTAGITRSQIPRFCRGYQLVCAVRRNEWEAIYYGA